MQILAYFIFFCCVSLIHASSSEEPAGEESSDTCPAEGLHHVPCKCQSSHKGQPSCHITCTHATADDLETVAYIPNLCNGDISLDLVQSTIEGIPAMLWNILLSSETVSVKVINSSLEGIVPPDGDSIPDVQTPGTALIEFQDSKVKEFDWKQLKRFRSGGTFSLFLDNTPVEEIGDDFSAIAGGKVHVIAIDHAGLKTIRPKEFAQFTRMQAISLQNNQLASVSRDMFAKPAKRLQYIHLNGNLLTSLPDDYFSEMPSLKIVYLRYNHLKTLPENIFASVPGTLKRIDLRDNTWKCDCKLMTILKNTYLQPDMGYCASPSNVAYMKVKDLKGIKC